MKACALTLALISAAAPLLGQPPESKSDATVWALDDTDKVHPITGAPISANSVWSASDETIRLQAGRNEFVAFQVVIQKGAKDIHKIFVNATDLIGSRERISADKNIRLFKELYLQLDGAWYPDALVPLEIAGLTPFELPDPKGPLGAAQKTQTIWVDVYVPHDLLPDTYRGQIKVLHRATNHLATLEVALEVGDFTLPDEMGLDVDLMNYGFLNIERGWPDLVMDSPRHHAIEKSFFRMAHEHRTTFAIVSYNHDGSIPPGAKPLLAGAGDSIRVADWSSWDARYGPVLSGEAFQDLPRRGQPVNHFFLPYNLMWPSDIRNWRKPEYRAEHLRVSEEFRKHLAAKGWTTPQYQIYYNHKEGYGFFPWNLDEPTRPADLEALEYLGKTIQEGFPKNSPVHVALRLDIGHFHCENVKDCRHPRDTSRQVVQPLGPLVDLWNIGSPHYWANLPEVRKLKAQGKTLYFYNGTTPVPAALLDAVTWGWQGYKYEADGICFWNATDWTDWDTDALPADPYTNAGGRYKGFSMVFYPGSKFGFDGPIASMRLKAMRRGLQDYEYLRLIEAGKVKSRDELIRLADESLPTGSAPRNYASLRRTLYEALAAHRK